MPEKKMKDITSFDNTEVDFTSLLECGKTLPQLRRSKTRVNWASFVFCEAKFSIVQSVQGKLTWLDMGNMSMALLFAPLSQPLVFV